MMLNQFTGNARLATMHAHVPTSGTTHTGTHLVLADMRKPYRILPDVARILASHDKL